MDGAPASIVAPGYAFSLKGVYQPKEDQFAEVEVVTSPVDAPREVRAREAEGPEREQHQHHGATEARVVEIR